jgi:hypothetical protein
LPGKAASCARILHSHLALASGTFIGSKKIKASRSNCERMLSRFHMRISYIKPIKPVKNGRQCATFLKMQDFFEEFSTCCPAPDFCISPPPHGIAGDRGSAARDRFALINFNTLWDKFRPAIGGTLLAMTAVCCLAEQNSEILKQHCHAARQRGFKASAQAIGVTYFCKTSGAGAVLFPAAKHGNAIGTGEISSSRHIFQLKNMFGNLSEVNFN